MSTCPPPYPYYNKFIPLTPFLCFVDARLGLNAFVAWSSRCFLTLLCHVRGRIHSRICQAGVSGLGDHGVEGKEPLSLPAAVCWHRTAEAGVSLLRLVSLHRCVLGKCFLLWFDVWSWKGAAAVLLPSSSVFSLLHLVQFVIRWFRLHSWVRIMEAAGGNFLFLTRNYSLHTAVLYCPLRSKEAAVAPSITFACSNWYGNSHWLLQSQGFVLQSSSHKMSALTGSCHSGEYNALAFVVLLLWSFFLILAVLIHAQLPLQDTQERRNQDRLCWLLHKAHICSFVFYTELTPRWK